MAAKGLSDVVFQEQVDYVNDAQKRVSGETFCYELRADFPLTGGVHEYLLPPELSYLISIFNGDQPLDELAVDDLVATLGGPGPGNYVGPQGYALVGTTLYVLPTPSEAQTLTLIYYAYSPDFNSPDELVIEHSCVMAMEHLIEAYLLLDNGETEMGVNCLTLAETDMMRVRRSERGRGGHPDRMRVVGYDQL